MNLNEDKAAGFSLIELMVVIAIVGILAAVAVPYYNSYMIKSKATSIVPIVDSLINKSIQFSATNGRFGNAHDLGLNPTPGGTGPSIVSDPKSLSQYFFSGGNYAVWVQDNDGVANSGGCGRSGAVQGFFDPATLGVDSSLVDSFFNIWFQCFYWNNSGVIEKRCFYSWGTGAVAQAGDLIPGWTNLQQTGGCCFGSNSYLDNTPSWVNSTCQ